jgi:hypothetical protein
MLRALLGRPREPLVREAVEALARARGGLSSGESLERWVAAEFVRYFDEPARTVEGPSSVAGGGSGLYAARDLAAGELATLYPGIHFPAPPVALEFDGLLNGHAYTLGTSLPCNDRRLLEYVLALGDGALVDATPACLADCCVLRRRMPRANALGHRVNHPPPGARPSTLVLCLRDFPEASRHVPGKYLAGAPTVPAAFSHVGPGGEAVALLADDPRRAPRLVGLLAVAPIKKGDEIFLDYVVPPSPQAAGWFAPVAAYDKATARALASAQAAQAARATEGTP